MARIHTLPAEEAHKIAAGEIVERPVSVVKELLENALDADSHDINITITDGGRERIHITDDGHGMDQDDIRACIQQHATSKITACSQLQSVPSFGFRGEALSSISNISTLTITSQEQNSSEGYTITVDGGTITHENITARSPGTEVIVDNLFYNVPARKKFLKKRETEWRAIYQLCTAMALSRPHCAFSIVHDGKSVLRCPRANDYTQRLSQIHDQYFARQFIACTHTDTQADIAIDGRITHPEYHRYDRSMLTCFVNGRWIKNHRLSQAIVKGYADILPHRRFPAGYLFITVPSHEVDINVHPRKEEVQFLHPRRVERAIESAVRSALEAYTQSQLTKADTHYNIPETQHNTGSATPYNTPSKRHVTPSVDGNMHTDETYATYPSHHVITQNPRPTHPDTANTHDIHTDNRAASSSHVKQPHTQASYHQDHIPSSNTDEQVTPDYHIIGQVHHTYIIVENADGCVFIDQHAAHERILYETFADNTHIATTHLVFPHRINMNESDCDHVMHHASLLHRYGIELDRFDTTHIVITAVPVALKGIDWSDMLQQLISTLPEARRGPQEHKPHPVYHDMCATMACKAAIKAGDTLSHTEMHEIVHKLYTCPHRMTCPHGRPTIITLSHDDLERKFKRKA